MPAFAYRAVDGRGARHAGREEASSQDALRRVLERRGLMVLDSSEVGSSFGFGGRADPSGLLVATRTLSSFLQAGLPLAKALEIARGLATTPRWQRVLESLSTRVQRGDPLHRALEALDPLFPSTYVGVVRAGERAGDLAGAFRRLETRLEREEMIRSRLLSAAIYPAILAVVGGLSLFLLTVLVLPRFADLLADAGATLPGTTRLLLALSSGLAVAWPFLVFGAPLALFLLGTALKTERGRRSAARLVLDAPGIGTLRRQALGARLASLLAGLIAGGAPLLDALEDVGDSLRDPVARDEVVRIRLRVREGSRFHEALSESSAFPPLLSRLVAVGEEAGRLQEFLEKAGEVLEGQLARTTERLAGLAEPAMIVAFGAMVGFVALSLLQAIYGVNAGSL